jgi:membrane associated rhomboid family serine protease
VVKQFHITWMNGPGMLTLLNSLLFGAAAFAGHAFTSAHTEHPARAWPAATILLLVLVGLPSLLQLRYPGVFTSLRGDPTLIFTQGQLWRVITALVVQDGGIAGTVFNLLTLALVGVVAERVWGRAITLAIFFGCGIALNLLGLSMQVAVAGNSGATFGLGASVAGLVLVRRGRGLGAALVCLASALLLLLALHNPHGLAALLGALVGGVVALAKKHRAERSA